MVDDAGVILKGHGRRLAALEAGLATFPVVVHRGLPEAEKAAMRVADNQVALLSGWDDALLIETVHDLSLAEYPLPLLGFDDKSLALLNYNQQDAGQDDDPEIPPLPKSPITKRGDIWQLDRHVLMCGDCRDDVDVRSLITSPINLAFTSPPYASQRDYDEKSGFQPIPPSDYVEWFNPVARLVADHLASDGSWFVNIKASADGLDTYLYVFDLVLAHVRKWGWHFATEFCWERSGVPKSVTRRFKNQFEPIYQFVRNDWKMRPWNVAHPSLNVPIAGGPGVGNTSWKTAQGGNGPFFGAQKKWAHYDDRPTSLHGKPSQRRRRGLGVGPTTASTLQGIPGAYGRDTKRKRGFPSAEGLQGTSWQSDGMPLGIPSEEIGEGLALPGNRLPTFSHTHQALGHAAAFPVGLPSFFVRAFTDKGDAVYDPFMGSGSTLIAAHKEDRRCFGMEISPAYVDVIIERWQNASGGKAKK